MQCKGYITYTRLDYIEIALNVHKVANYESTSGRYANPDVSRNTDVATLSFSWIKNTQDYCIYPDRNLR